MAILSRKTASKLTAKARGQKAYAARTTALAAGAVGASVGTADWHLRITALETAARVNQTGDAAHVLNAAEKFYTFLTGK